MKDALWLSATFAVVLTTELALAGNLTPAFNLYASALTTEEAPREPMAARPQLRIELYDPQEEYFQETETPTLSAPEPPRSGTAVARTAPTAKDTAASLLTASSELIET